MRGFALGYLVGLVVGEGSFTQDGKPVLSVKLHEDDPIPLLMLKRAFGGQVYGPYAWTGKDGKTRRYRVWHLRSAALMRALPLLAKSLPPSRKRDQFETWADRHRLRMLTGAGQRELFIVEHRRKKVVPKAVASSQLRLMA